MGWELLAIKFGFQALDYVLAIAAREPARMAEARPFIAMTIKMIDEKRGPNAADYVAMDALHQAFDDELDSIIAEDEASPTTRDR